MRKVLIIALSDGYRRAGMVFGTEPTEVDLSELDKKIVKAIEDDKNLTIKPMSSEGECQACTKCQQELEAATKRNVELQDELEAATKRIAELEANKSDAEHAEDKDSSTVKPAAKTAAKATAKPAAKTAG